MMCVPAHFRSCQFIDPKDHISRLLTRCLSQGPFPGCGLLVFPRSHRFSPSSASLGSTAGVLVRGTTLRTVSLRSTPVIVLSPVLSGLWAASVVNSLGNCIWVSRLLWNFSADAACHLKFSQGETSPCLFLWYLGGNSIFLCYFSNQFSFWYIFLLSFLQVPSSPFPSHSNSILSYVIKLDLLTQVSYGGEFQNFS